MITSNNMDKDTARVLNWVNRLRRSIGETPIDELPAGKPNTVLNNPISIATKLKFREGTYMVEGGRISDCNKLANVVSQNIIKRASHYNKMFHVPKYVHAWINKYNDMRYPELVVSVNNNTTDMRRRMNKSQYRQKKDH